MLKATIADNRPEFADRALDQWARMRSLELYFVRPGNPTENALLQAFNSRIRGECLSSHHLAMMSETQSTIIELRSGPTRSTRSALWAVLPRKGISSSAAGAWPPLHCCPPPTAAHSGLGLFQSPCDVSYKEPIKPARHFKDNCHTRILNA